MECPSAHRQHCSAKKPMAVADLNAYQFSFSIFQSFPDEVSTVGLSQHPRRLLCWWWKCYTLRHTDTFKTKCQNCEVVMRIDNKWFKGCITSQEGTELPAALAEMGIPSTVIKHLYLFVPTSWVASISQSHASVIKLIYQHKRDAKLFANNCVVGKQ